MHHYGKGVLLAVTLALTGCQGFGKGNKVTITPRAGQPVTGATLSAPAGEGIKGQLATCLFEADQLLKMNPAKYREPVNALYRDIRQAKYYAAVAARLSAGSTDTLTPMYQYKVNDACNTVSQMLLTEFKQGNTVMEGNR